MQALLSYSFEGSNNFLDVSEASSGKVFLSDVVYKEGCYYVGVLTRLCGPLMRDGLYYEKVGNFLAQGVFELYDGNPPGFCPFLSLSILQLV